MSLEEWALERGRRYSLAWDREGAAMWAWEETGWGYLLDLRRPLAWEEVGWGVSVGPTTDFGVSVGSWVAVGEASFATCSVEGEGEG